MADDVTIKDSTNTTKNVATDEIAGNRHTQIVKLMDGRDASALVIPGDATDGLFVQVKTNVPGTGATNLGKAEDAVHTSGDTGVMALGVQQTADAAFAANGDYVPMQFDSSGNLKVNVKAGAAAVTQFAEDAAHTTGDEGMMVLGVQRSSDTALAGTDGDYVPIQFDSSGFLKVNVKAGNATVTQYAEDAGHVSGDTGIMALAVRQDADAALAGTTLDYTPIQVDANGYVKVNIKTGKTQLWDLTTAVGVDSSSTGLKVYVAGSAISGTVDASSNSIIVGNVAAAATDSGSPVKVGGKYNSTLPTYTDGQRGDIQLSAKGRQLVEAQGDVAHDGVDANNPVKLGAIANANLAGITAVAAADRTNLYAGLDGVLIVRPYCNLEDNKADVITSTGAAAGFAAAFAAVASSRHYVTQITLCNSSAVNVNVDIRDGAAGAVLYTVPCPAGGGAVVNLVNPLRFTANTAVAIDPSAAASTITASIAGFTSKI